MYRLFVAVRPPPEIRDFLAGLMGGISGARWQDDGQLHLTLRFIGEVDRHTAGDIHAALGSIHHPRFELAVNGLGMFDKKNVVHTIWAGVAPQQPITALHKKVDQAMARVGIPPDERAFHPHVTLARLNRSAGPVTDFLSRSAGVTSQPFRVDRFALFESSLTPDGAVYTEVETYPLA